MFAKAPIRRAAPRRALVLTDEAASHPFRASLPPHVRDPLFEPDPRGWRMSRGDWRVFLNTYVAGFAAVTAFIA